MAELVLIYKDENGAEKRVSVSEDAFTIGRHSTNDLSIADGRLSREHLKVERFGEIFVASDLGSSNGTSINGRKLASPMRLQNGDSLNLGGLDFKVNLSGEAYAGNSVAYFDDDDDDFAEKPPVKESDKQSAPTAPAAPPTAPSAPASGSSASGSSTSSFLFVAPILGVFILVILGGLFFLFRGGGETDVAGGGDDFIYTNSDSNSDTGGGEETSNTASNDKEEVDPPGTEPNNSGGQTNGNPGGETNSTGNSNVPTPTPANLNETAKIEMNSAAFLRRIAQNDPKAFLTSDQAKIVGAKIKQFSGSSSAVADNIKSARANSAQLTALANSKNLKPQFLACVAIARLGNNRGNVLQTAQSMAENLDKLVIHVGGERSDDALLMVAAYDQTASGQILQFRNMLQQLSNQFPESSRTIRSIWFLRQKNKISEAEYESALRFLAIGTVTQNPKEFGVNAEELKLN